MIGTEHAGEFCIEQGPDGVLRSLPWGTGLFSRLGLESELIGTNAQHKQSWIMRSGRLKPLPEGLAIMAPRKIWPTVKSPILNASAKLRMACELFIRQKDNDTDESLAAFARRRFGRGAFERLIQPLVSGIYMADPEKLSMQAGLPRFVEMEAKHRSLIKAARIGVRQQKEHAPGESSGKQNESMFVTPGKGLGQLIDVLESRLPVDTVRLKSSVKKLVRSPSEKWQLQLTDGVSHTCDGVILATPSNVSASLLTTVHRSLSEQLSGIRHAGCIIVTLAFPRHAIQHSLNGHGFVVPHVEGREIVACTFSSVKYDQRAPGGQVLLRVFLGGATKRHVMDFDDDELLAIVSRELNPSLGIRSAPILTRIHRWPQIMPQYYVGHLDRMRRIDEMSTGLSALELAGNSYRGVGIPHCIRSGEQAADRLLQSLEPPELAGACADRSGETERCPG